MKITPEDMTARCEQIIGTLVIPHPFDIDDFLAVLSEQRRKPIKRVRTDLGWSDFPCGMLLTTLEMDYICSPANVPASLERHSTVHEVGHLLFNHGTLSEGSAAAQLDQRCSNNALSILLPDLAPSLIQRILGRTVYDTDEEQEAELFASLLLARVTSPRNAHSKILPAGAGPLARLGSALAAPARRIRHG